MITEKDLKYKNNLYYNEDKLFTGQMINIYQDKFWFKEGRVHRESDLPAVEDIDGTKYWYKEGKYHRETGPAIEYSNGNKYWYKEGKYHRETGPAIEDSNGEKYWYYNGKEINCKDNEEFLRIIKLLLFK